MQTKSIERSVDLVEILERDVYPRLSPKQIYNWAGHNFKESGDRMRGNPPWGQSKSGSSFAVFADLGFLDSHNGQESGDPIKYVYSLKVGRYEYPKGRDWIETVKALFDMAAVPFPDREWTPEQVKAAQRRESRQTVLKLVQDYCQGILWSEAGEPDRRHLMRDRGFSEDGLRDFEIGVYPTVREVRQYLLERGIDLDFAQEIGLLTDKWEGYMTFPWATPYGQPLTLYGHQSKEWAERTGKPKKYALFNPKDDLGAWLHTKESPYLFNRAVRDRHKELVLVEGITDAAIAHQFGDTRVVACVGAMLTKDQAQILARHGIERVIIALDPDQAGDKGIESCIKSLTNVGVTPYVAPRLMEGVDPDDFILDYGIEPWKFNTSQAIHGYRWKAEQIIATADLTTDIGREIATKTALTYASSQSNQLAIEQYFSPAIEEGLGINKFQQPEPQEIIIESRIAKKLDEFDQVIAKLSDISSIESKARQFYDYTLFRKTIGLSDRELKQVWQLSQTEKKPFDAVCSHKFIGENPESRKWLIPKFIPAGSLIIWYAEGGKGKTLAAYDAVRCIASGADWLGSKVHRSHKCLIIQTEESKADTQDRLIIQGYLEEVPEETENSGVLITNEFTFSQIDELAKFIEARNIDLVVIDSLTAANQDSTATENDVAYGNMLLELRNKIVNPMGCTILVIHHENKNSGIRGSTAIKANVDFVTRLHSGGSEDKLTTTERIFEIEKARGGILGRFVVSLNTFNYHWDLTAHIDEYGNRKVVDDRLASRIIGFLRLNPDRDFTVKELVEGLENSFVTEVIRAEAEVLRRIGEIGGRYKKVQREDGTKFGFWKYYSLETQQLTEPVATMTDDEDEFEEEF